MPGSVARVRPLARPPPRERPTPAALLERERLSRNGPVWFAMAMALGAAQYIAAPREVVWLAILVALAALGSMAWVARGRVASSLITLPLAFVLGLALAKGEVARTDTAMMVGEATTRVTGRVIGRTHDARGRYRYLVRVDATHDPQLQFPPSRARLFVSAGHDPLPIGSTLEALARLRQPSGPARPGGYDFALQAWFDGLGAHGFVLGRPTMVAPPGDLTVRERIDVIRAGVATIARERLDGAAGGVAAALLTGDRRGIPDDVTEALRASGLAHVLAISGMHMALVAGLVLSVLRLGLALHPTWSSRYPTKKLAAAAALVVASAYLALSGGAVSAQRAHAMLSVMLLATLLDRPALTMRNVGLAAILVIAWRPHEVVAPGFQMSFGATAALIAAYGWWRRRPRGVREEPLLPPFVRSLVVGFVAILFTSFVAGLATGVFAVHHFHRAAPLGLLGNGLAMPIVSFVVMPSAIVSALAMPFGLEAWPMAAMGWGIEAVIAISAWVSTLAPSVSLGAIGTPAFMLFTLALFLACAMRTLLVAIALVPAVAGALLIERPGDRLWIAERGELVAAMTEEGMAFARSRPNAFIADQWLDATAARMVSANDNPHVFSCEPKDAFCTIEAGGLRIVSVRDRSRWGEGCDRGDIVVTPVRLRTTRCRSGAWLIHARRTNETGSVTVDLDGLVAGIDLAHDVPGLSVLRNVPTADLERYAMNAVEPGIRPWTAHRHAVIRRRPRASGSDE